MKTEVIGTVVHEFNDWGFDTGEHVFSDDVVVALDELLEGTTMGDKYKITIEKL